MGNLCDKYADSKEGPKQQRTSVSSKSQLNKESQVSIRDKRKTSDTNLKDNSFTLSGKIENSFNRNNEIGAYFCGGSVEEKHALSYAQRISDFEGIIEKSKKENRKYLKSNNKQPERTNTNQDMAQKFNEKFNFLSGCGEVNPKDLQKYIKKGVPIKYRWASWKSYLQNLSNLDLQETKKLFNQLQMESKEEVQIEKDINRTFPSYPYFATKNLIHNQRDNNSINGYLPLKRVLISISNMYPDLGYCQGMNFILGFVLMINGAQESEAFWMFKLLAEHPDFMLMGLYESDLPLLKFLEYLSKKILKKHCKELMDYFKWHEIPDSFWLTKWILTLFLYNFPVKTCSRFWDFFITNGIFSIIKLMIPLLEVFKDGFMQQEDSCAFMEYYTKITQNENYFTDPESDLYLNITEIVKKADTYKIEKKVIAKYAKKFVSQGNENNDYAKLYSHYNNSKEFQNYHQKLLKNKVKLTIVPEEKDKLEDSSSLFNKETFGLQKTYADSRQSSELNKTNSNYNIKDQQSNKMFEEISKQQVKISSSHDFDKQDSNMTTNVDLKSKINQDGSEIQQNNTGNQKIDENNQEENKQDNCETEISVVRHKSNINIFTQNTQNSAENQNDSYENDMDFVEIEQKPKNESTFQRKRCQKSQTQKQDHQDAIAFDNESFNMFQSLMNKSIETPLNQKSKVEYQESIDDSEDEYQIEYDENNQNSLKNKLNILDNSAIISQNDLTQADQIDFVYNNKIEKQNSFIQINSF